MPSSLQRLAQREDDAVAGGLGAAERAAHADRLAGDEAGVAAAVDRLELVEHPEHVLRVGHDVGRRHVADRADVLRELAHPAAADRLLLARRSGCAGRRSRRPCRRRAGCRRPRTSRSSTWRARARCRSSPAGGSGCRPWPGRGRRCAGRGSRGRPSRVPSSMRTGMRTGTRAAGSGAARGWPRRGRGCRRPCRTGPGPSRTS